MQRDLKVNNKSLKEEIEMAIKAGKEFSELYYKMHKSKREKMDRLYHESATLIYRGTTVKGKDKITKFIQDLPLCYFTLDTLDCQPVLKKFTGGRETLTVMVTGTAKYDRQPLRSFTQVFMILNDDHKWKILSDTMRLRDP